MEKIVKQVCIDMKSYYTITATSEEEAQQILDGYLPRLVRRYFRGVFDWLGNRKAGSDRIACTMPVVFASVEGVDDPTFNRSVIIPDEVCNDGSF